MYQKNSVKKDMKRFTVIGCVALFLFMAAMAAAAVPLYAIFCQATGYGGTTRRVEQYSDRILGRTITVRFDANTAIGLPWKFQPALHEIKLKIGETIQIHYTAENLSSEPTSGWASFNVMPGAAGIYFNKVECFCFVDTTLQPGEKMDMPVLFYIDPAIIDSPELKDLHTIILSYTFFPAQGNQRTEEPEKRSGKHGKAKREG